LNHCAIQGGGQTRQIGDSQVLGPLQDKHNLNMSECMRICMYVYMFIHILMTMSNVVPDSVKGAAGFYIC